MTVTVLLESSVLFKRLRKYPMFFLLANSGTFSSKNPRGFIDDIRDTT